MKNAFDSIRIRTMEDLCGAVRRFGIVPLFRNRIPGFSVEEHVDPSVWFADSEGVWEWKGPVIRATGCAYGRVLFGQTAFVMLEWYRALANARRDGYDFDARYEDGLAPYPDRVLYELLEEHEPVISKRLKEAGDYRKGGRKGFDSSMNRLQHQCYVLISDFVYLSDRYGRPYGWGLAEYSTPERRFGTEFSDRVYGEEPEESRERVVRHLAGLFPEADEQELRKEI